MSLYMRHLFRVHLYWQMTRLINSIINDKWNLSLLMMISCQDSSNTVDAAAVDFFSIYLHNYIRRDATHTIYKLHIILFVHICRQVFLGKYRHMERFAQLYEESVLKAIFHG